MVLAHLPYNVLVAPLGVDHCGRTLLQHAAMGKCGALSETIVDAMLLRLQKVDVNARSRRGFTALHYAANQGHTQICTIIMRSMKSEVLMPALGSVAPGRWF